VNINTRLLKRLLIVGAVILIFGYGMVGVEVYRRISGTAAAIEPGVAVQPVVADSDGIKVVPLGLGEGARLESVTAVGGRVLVLVRERSNESAHGGDRLLVLDPVAGRVTAVFPVGPESAAK